MAGIRGLRYIRDMEKLYTQHKNNNNGNMRSKLQLPNLKLCLTRRQAGGRRKSGHIGGEILTLVAGLMLEYCVFKTQE